MRGWLDPGQPERDQRGQRADVEFEAGAPRVPYIVPLDDVFGPDGLMLHGTRYHWLYVNLFGHVSLTRSVDHYLHDLGLEQQLDPDFGPVIAPFDSHIASALCHAPPEGGVMANAVRWCHSPGRLVVTWHQVLPAGGGCDDVRAASRRKQANTFQLVIAHLEPDRPRVGDYAIEFRYESCEWMGANPDARRGWVAIRHPARPGSPLARVGVTTVPDDVDPTGPSTLAGLVDLCRASNLRPADPGVFRFEVKAGEADVSWPSALNDFDGDGLIPPVDNCQDAANLRQRDDDRDDVGDVCDDDRDGDGHPNDRDNCPFVANADQRNSVGDYDGDDPLRWCRVIEGGPPADDLEGDACETDHDGDGIPTAFDLCPRRWNEVEVPGVWSTQTDLDGDGIGDDCDFDWDGDGWSNDLRVCGALLEVPDDVTDNCPTLYNPDQSDMDGDGQGDACDLDIDGDGMPQCCNQLGVQAFEGFSERCVGARPESGAPCLRRRADGALISGLGDNCPTRFNPGQSDRDGDGLGDACDPAARFVAPSADHGEGATLERIRAWLRAAGHMGGG